MSTDAIIHLHLALDRVRETQTLHGELLREILRRQKLLMSQPSKKSKEASDSSPATKLSFFLKQIAVSGGQWAGGVLAMAYVLKGGDLMTGMKTLVELLKQF